MRYQVEIMLRGNQTVFAETLTAPEPESWTASDVEAMLKDVLGAVDRAQNPETAGERPISLRGMNWIVQPTNEGVVIAFEIHSASAVAGPFPVPQERLDRLMREAMASGQRGPTVH